MELSERKKTLKENTGLTYSQYILALRIDYACQLLSDPNNNLFVEEIDELSGFSSRETFYRQFKKNYNMSPAQFKNMKQTIHQLNN